MQFRRFVVLTVIAATLGVVTGALAGISDGVGLCGISYYQAHLSTGQDLAGLGQVKVTHNGVVCVRHWYFTWLPVWPLIALVAVTLVAVTVVLNKKTN